MLKKKLKNESELEIERNQVDNYDDLPYNLRKGEQKGKASQDKSSPSGKSKHKFANIRTTKPKNLDRFK